MKYRVDFGFAPYAHQKAAHALREAVRFLVLVWHRRAGKTVFAVMELLLAALLCKRQDGRFAYVAPLLKQAKTVSWDYLKRYARMVPKTEVNESELSIRLPNGARVRLFGADNPDSLRGVYFDGVVLDEVADMKPEVWGEIIRPALSDANHLGWAIFIGTPKGVNLFSEIYNKAKNEDGWATDLRRASDTHVIPDAELEAARREMSEVQFAQEFDCDFSAASDDVLLKLDEVLEAQKRGLHPNDYIYAPKTLGIDVARYGSDRTSLFPRQGLAGFKPEVRRGLSVTETISLGARMIEAFKPDGVFVDAGGIGAGVVDGLRSLGFSVIEVHFGERASDERFENKRAEMWWNAAAWVKAGGALPALEELTQDLSAPRFTYKNARGRLQLESKDDMRARGLPSPDVGDSFVLTFAHPIAPKALAGQESTQAAHCKTDFNPLDDGRDRQQQAPSNYVYHGNTFEEFRT